MGVWIGGVWNGHFPESEKYFSGAEISRKIPEIPQKNAIFSKFQAPKFENSEPEKMQFHTPSHFIPPLDSLLILVSPLSKKPESWDGFGHVFAFLLDEWSCDAFFDIDLHVCYLVIVKAQLGEPFLDILIFFLLSFFILFSGKTGTYPLTQNYYLRKIILK